MNKDIWHTELNDFEKEQIFYCVFFTKKDPLLMRIGYYHPVKIKFGDYVNEYTPDKIKKFIKIDDLLDLETKLDRTRKALDVAKDALTEYTDEKRYDWERCYELHSAETAKKALEQITALEQKDVK